MIEVRNLTKIYPGTVAVDDVSFSVNKGEIIGFLGPNGAGKSTTMKMLTCFLPPTAGSARVAGFDVLTQSMDVRRRVGYLPENNPLYPEMRVEEYLDYRATLWRVPRRERIAAVTDALDKCGLLEVRNRIIGQLSKGNRQRVGLADAIVHNPDILILDEPTIGLDPNQMRRIREVIRELGQSHTVILSTHILSEVEKICSRVLIISAGKLVADGTPSQIVNRLTTTGRLRLDVHGAAEGAKDTLERIGGVRAVVVSARDGGLSFLIEMRDGRDMRAEIFALAVKQGWEVVEFAPERVSLEDAFVELTRAQTPVKDHLAAKPEPAEAPRS